MLRILIFTFQVTAHSGLLLVRRRLAGVGKEGGKVKSYKNCPGQTRSLVKMEVFVGILVCGRNLN